MHAENADLGWRVYQVSGGVNEWCQIRSEGHRDQLQCDVRIERETEDSIRDDTQGNVMQGTQGRQGRGVAAARMWTVKWAGGESIKVTRISLRCPLHRSGITAADISQASLDTCVSPSPPLSSPAEFYPASPRAGAGRKQKQLPATRPGHRRHFPCELSAILILTLVSVLHSWLLSSSMRTLGQSWCGHECYRSIRY